MSKKVLIVTGNKPEHFGLIDVLMETEVLCGAVLQIDESEKRNINPFFKTYEEDVIKAIHRFFGVKYSHTSNLPTKPISHTKINSEETINFINSLEPNLLINFDTEPLNSETISKIKCEKWKIHAGNIEKFKGYYGNFWASYMLMKDSIGHTIHLLEDEYGHGDIIHRTQTLYRPEDTVQDMEMRSLRRLINDMPNIIKNYVAGNIEYKKQLESGFYFDENRIKEKHMKVIYDFFGNKYENIFENIS